MKRLFFFIIASSAALQPVYASVTNSNAVTVKAWTRDAVHFDTATGEFSSTNIPSSAQSAALDELSGSISELYDYALEEMETNMAPLEARLEEARRRPVVTLALAASPENAVDRRNFTMCVLSNEISRIDGGLHCRFWIFGNNVLRSDPVMVGSVITELGAKTNELSLVWTGYGENGVTIVDDGEEYECFELAMDIPAEVKDGLDILVLPWIRIGRRDTGFDFGNRQCRVNGVMCCTTNDLSFLGTFYTTNGVEIIDYKPYADRGLFRFTEKEDEQPQE